jgi:hypothetical protein
VIIVSFDAVGCEHLTTQIRALAAQVAKAASTAASAPWHRDGMSDAEREEAFRAHADAIKQAYVEAMAPYRTELRDTVAAYWHSARTEGLVGADEHPDAPIRIMNPVNDFGLERLADMLDAVAARAGA